MRPEPQTELIQRIAAHLVLFGAVDEALTGPCDADPGSVSEPITNNGRSTCTSVTPPSSRT